MHRYIVRLSVALVTFMIGLVVSSILGVFGSDRTACSHKEMLTLRLVNRGNVQPESSALISIETQPGEPVKLLYIATTPGSLDSNRRQVHFELENRGGKAVVAYRLGYGLYPSFGSISYSGSTSQGSGSGAVFGKLGRGALNLEPGTSTPVIIRAGPDQWLNAWVESVDFADGSQWETFRR